MEEKYDTMKSTTHDKVMVRKHRAKKAMRKMVKKDEGAMEHMERMAGGR